MYSVYHIFEFISSWTEKKLRSILNYFLIKWTTYTGHVLICIFFFSKNDISPTTQQWQLGLYISMMPYTFFSLIDHLPWLLFQTCAWWPCPSFSIDLKSSNIYFFRTTRWNETKLRDWKSLAIYFLMKWNKIWIKKTSFDGHLQKLCWPNSLSNMATT